MVNNSFLSASGGSNGAMTWIFVGLLVVLVIVLLVVPMFTNKKRAKQTSELHNSLKPGDVIKTVGGIIGTIKEIRKISPVDTEMVIETGDGDNKTTMTFDIQALYMILSRSNNVSAPAATDDIFDEPAEKSDDKAVIADDKAVEPEKAETVEEKAEEKAEEKQEEKAEEKAAEPADENAAVADADVDKPVQEQAATAEAEKPEEKPKEPTTAESKPKAKSSTSHKPVQKKANANGAKKSTKK